MSDRQPERLMSSTPSRLPLLPPYALPLVGEATRARATGAAARTPFVPPTYVPRSVAGSATAPTEAPTEAQTETPTEEQTETQTDKANNESLPWIDAFAEDDVATPTETWAIDDATVSISHLAQELTAASGVTPPLPKPDVHTPWKDDEAWMDIMPALPNTGSADPAMDTSWARAFAEPPASLVPPPLVPPPLPSGDAQAAASALESVARRLRAGELRVPGFHAEAGDAAALAATLASLLGGHE